MTKLLMLYYIKVTPYYHCSALGIQSPLTDLSPLTLPPLLPVHPPPAGPPLPAHSSAGPGVLEAGH